MYRPSMLSSLSILAVTSLAAAETHIINFANRYVSPSPYFLFQPTN